MSCNVTTATVECIIGSFKLNMDASSVTVYMYLNVTLLQGLN